MKMLLPSTAEPNLNCTSSIYLQWAPYCTPWKAMSTPIEWCPYHSGLFYIFKRKLSWKCDLSDSMKLSHALWLSGIDLNYTELNYTSCHSSYTSCGVRPNSIWISTRVEWESVPKFWMKPNPDPEQLTIHISLECISSLFIIWKHKTLWMAWQWR